MVAAVLLRAVRVRRILRGGLIRNWRRLFPGQSSGESSPEDLIDDIKQEAEELKRALDQVMSQAEEHEKEWANLKNVSLEVQEEMSAVKSGADVPSQRTSTLTARVDHLDKRVEAFKRRQDKIIEDKNVLREAAKKLSERATTEASEIKIANLEFQKMLFEIFKLVATLDTGALIAMTAITVGLISEPVSLRLFFISCVLVLSSIVFSVGAALYEALNVSETIYRSVRPPSSRRSSYGYWVSVLGSLLGLVIGIIVFTQFLARNLG